MSNQVVETNNLTKCYGNFIALDKLSISLNKGQILGFIGPNGAGKTTTIKILVGLAKPTAGSAFVEGIDCFKQAKKIKKLVGYMPDTFGSYDNMRVREYLDFFGAAFGISWMKRAKRIDEVLEISNATYMQDLFVESLSHGMKQRVGIARTLLHDPSVLILDEPANGLDPQARIEMRELLLSLAAAGKTLIVTSHILPELSRICDQVAIITKGKLRAYGPLDEIMKTFSQKRTIEVQLTGTGHLENALKLIAERVTDCSGATASTAESVVRFQTEQQDSDLSGILADLVNHEIPVAQFRELQTDLEDAFLSVTQEDGKGTGESATNPGATEAASTETPG
ncbi:MAG: ABC transporter ATP-binding protein [Planctomycetota bacterium]|nr:ABC transporter ATP-binding protein [Planctomycetota bacterium]